MSPSVDAVRRLSPDCPAKRSWCLRVSGAVAPSALTSPGKARQRRCQSLPPGLVGQALDRIDSGEFQGECCSARNQAEEAFCLRLEAHIHEFNLPLSRWCLTAASRHWSRNNPSVYCEGRKRIPAHIWGRTAPPWRSKSDPSQPVAELYARCAMRFVHSVLAAQKRRGRARSRGLAYPAVGARSHPRPYRCRRRLTPSVMCFAESVAPEMFLISTFNWSGEFAVLPTNCARQSALRTS